MESFSATDIIKILKEKNITYFSLSDFGRLFSIKNQNTLYKKIQRLEKENLVKKLIKGKYLFLLSPENDYLTANFLCQPSYISLETALSFYAVITGFPHKITSLTIKKSRTFRISPKDFVYSHINRDLYWGYEKNDEFLIADKEKAFLDYLYFFSKGLRSFHADEFDFSGLNFKKLHTYEKRFSSSKLSHLIKNIL